MEHYTPVYMIVFWPVIRRWRAMRRRELQLRRAGKRNSVKLDRDSE